MTPSRRALPLAAALVLALLAGLTVSACGDGEVALLPDLEQRPPNGIQVTERPGGGPRRFRLGFISAVDNVGRGPLLVRATRLGRADAAMAADQLVRLESGTRRRNGVATLRYTVSADHSHWHYLGFERYELRRARDFSRVRRDRKTGFCLGDRYQSDPSKRLPGEPAKPVWTDECGKSQPALLRLDQGISVGYGDDYAANLEGQYLDVTGLPAGNYQVVHRVNADRRLEESDYSNNAAAALIELSWPRGMRRAPEIRMTAVCDTERCRGAE